MTHCNKSVAKNAPDRTQVLSALAMGTRRAMHHVGGKGTLAERIGANVKTIDRTLTEETALELHRALALLLVDQTALDEVFALYGVVVRPASHEAANDMHTIAGLSHAIGTWAEAMRDGMRDHRETLALAEQFRPLVQAIGAVIEQADAIRAGRAA